jgi:hypothetical protein
MRDDDDMLAGIDLGAWEAPPAPAGLADDVVAATRAAAAPRAAAIAVPALDASEAGPRRRRWWLAGGVAASAVAASLLLTRGLTRTASPADHGALTATAAQHLELDGLTLDLDAGAELRWRRDEAGLHVLQPRGASTYQVAAGSHLWIDAGATVATVEASGASLRVEVHMKPAIIPPRGLAAATAVAAVTIAVIGGHALIGGGAPPAVTINAGTTIEVVPGEAPREPSRVAGMPVAPVTPVGAPLTRGSRVLDEPAWYALLDAIDHEPATGAVADEATIVTAVRERLLIAAAAAAPCLAPQWPADTGEVSIDLVVRGARGVGAILDVAVEPSRFAEACVKAELVRVELPPIAAGKTWALAGRFRVQDAAHHASVTAEVETVTVAGTRTVATNPDATADELRRQMTEHFNEGTYAQALALAERLLAQGGTYRDLEFAYIAACHSQNTNRAHLYFRKLMPADQAKLSQICITEHIDPAADPTAAAPPLSSAAIGDVIKAKDGIYRACFQRELAHTPGLGGRLVIELTIAASGKVAQTRTVSDELGSSRVADCVRTNLATLVFPAGGGAVVSYPFLFWPAPSSPPAGATCQDPHGVDPFDPRPVCAR